MRCTPAVSPRRRVDGVLLLDKPPALSSNAALQRAKRMYAAEKAGHTGTLDPLASGLLPICFGEATKFAQSLLDARKMYVATLCFGIATATGDCEGEVVAQNDALVSLETFAGILSHFVGTIAQVPPRYSALKFKGRKYYDYARDGIEIPRESRNVQIDSLELVVWDFPSATIRVTCSKGTYVRALAEDLAKAVGTYAHLTALRRTGAGAFQIDGAVAIGELESMSREERDDLLLPIDAPLADMERLDIDADNARVLFQGRAGDARAAAAGRYRCFGPDREFIGVVEVSAGRMTPLRLVRAPAFAL